METPSSFNTFMAPTAIQSFMQNSASGRSSSAISFRQASSPERSLQSPYTISSGSRTAPASISAV